MILATFVSTRLAETQFKKVLTRNQNVPPSPSPSFSQACYGVATIPRGEWLCRVCSAGDEQATCILCPVAGGALKRVRPGNTSWAHLCCALWIPEVRVGNADKMEPITNIEAIPVSGIGGQRKSRSVFVTA